MPFATQKVQHPARILVVTRLAQYLARDYHDRVRAENETRREPLCCRLGLGASQSFDIVDGVLAGLPSLVSPAVDYLEGPADGAQYFGASGTTRRQEQRLLENATVNFFCH